MAPVRLEYGSEGEEDVAVGGLIPAMLTAEEKAARYAAEKAAAEQRLREVKLLHRDALLEIHTKERKSILLSGRHPLCLHENSCLANAITSSCASFLLAYGIRVGIGVLLRAFKLAKKRPLHKILNLQLLLSEKNLIVREEACRNGMLFGGFAGVYHAMRCLLHRIRGKEAPTNEFLSGMVAGLSVIALDDPSKRRTFALYLLARVAQSAYNSLKARGLLRICGAPLQHGDTALFCLASAQIMYAYVMRPETLPETYVDFICKTGPIDASVVKAVRQTCRGQPIDSASLVAYVRSKTNGLSPLELDENPPIIPCSVLHAGHASCTSNNLRVMQGTFKKTFPLYLSLTFVPFAILNLQKFRDNPFRTSWLALLGALRSTTFLSSFVGLYQMMACMNRKVSRRDNKLNYWFAGLVAGLATLLEKKSRRGELALYALPRAADSFWYILIRRHILPDIKYAEVALFSLCMGGIMYFYEYESDTMSPYLRGLLTRFVYHTSLYPDDDSATPSLNSPYLRAASFLDLREGAGDGLNRRAEKRTPGRHHRSQVVRPPPPPPKEKVVDPADRLEAEAFQGL